MLLYNAESFCDMGEYMIYNIKCGTKIKAYIQ